MESTVPGATTTILSAYETDFLASSTPVVPNPDFASHKGEVRYVNSQVAGSLVIEPKHHLLSFTPASGSGWHFDLKQIFAANITNNDFKPKSASLSRAIDYCVPYTNTTERTFTIFGFQVNEDSGKNPWNINKDYPLIAHTFESENSDLAVTWVKYIQHYIRYNKAPTGAPEVLKPLRYFLVYNPIGGARLAPKLLKEISQPMFQLAGIHLDQIETQHVQHGIELVNKARDLASYDAIIAAGGDGMLHEVVNGALTREDWRSIVQIPFGLLPAGSANGVAVSLGFRNYKMATVNLIRRHTQPYDIGAIYCSNLGERVIYSVLDGVTGYLSDCDDTADEMRWLGPLRIEVAGVIRALFLRKYRMRIYYLEKPLINSVTPFTPTPAVININEDTDSIPRPGPKPTVPNAIMGANSVTDPISERLSKDWKVIDGAFSQVAVTNVPFLTPDLCVSTTAHPTNRSLTIVHDNSSLSGWRFLKGILGEVLTPGKNTFLANMNEVKAHSIIIEGLGQVQCDKKAPASVPSTTGIIRSQIVGDRLITWDPVKAGSFRVDGELLSGTTALQIEVLPSLLSFIIPQ